MKKLFKLTNIITLIITLATIFINLIVVTVPAAKAAGTIPPKTQRIGPKTITSDPRISTPGVYWYQLDAGNFRADYSGGYKIVDWNRSCENPRPVDSEIPDEVDMSKWPAERWVDDRGIEINGANVQNIRLHRVDYINAPSYKPADSKPTIISEKKARINSITGQSYTPTYLEEFMKRPNGCPKMIVEYDTPVRITWAGDIYEEKEIDVNPDSTIGVGQKKQLNASVRTKDWGSDTWGIWYDVKSRNETTWISEDESIATVSSTGQVTGVSPGTVKIRAIWDNGTYRISDDATITVTAEPGLTVDSHEFCTSEGAASYQLEAHLTKSDGRTYDLTSHPKLTWSSSNPSVATVDQSGMVTSKGTVGTTTITAHFYDPDQNIDETGTSTVTVKDCGSGGGGDDGGGGAPGCTFVIGPPSKGTVISNSQLNPSASGMLRADNRGAEKFNVEQGIPTSESLYANVFGMNYLFSSKWANMTGQVTYTVTVKKTYHKTWTIPGRPSSGPGDPGVPPQPMERDVTVTKNMTVIRDYSYWQIDNLEVYKIDKATVSNYALGGYGGTVTLNPNGYTPPTLISENNDSVNSHVHPQPCSGVDLGTQTVPGGATEPPTPVEDSLFQSRAESAVKENKVNNDKVIFNGSTIMDSAQHDKTAPTPGAIPQPTTIGPNVLYQGGYVISKTLVNKANQPTTGKIYYTLIPGNIKGGADKNFDINGMNSITVHTPVVDYSYVSNDSAFNQKTNPNYSRNAFVLDRPITVTIPTTGQHNNYLGYGNRDYAKYTKDRQVQFEFGVFTRPNDNSSYIPPGTWISFPQGQDTMVFYMPVWIDEGDYNVYTRAIAENAPANFTTETNANLNWQNHVATRTLPVEVIGRVYDFRITDIGDFNWQKVFRIAPGSSTPSGVMYPVGDKGIDGTPNGFSFPYELPIRRGSHPYSEYKNVAIKTGYHFKFDLKTKGNMFGQYDSIRIKPSFYFVDMNGNRQPVDLYYHDPNAGKYFIKVGSSADVQKRNVTLDDRLRNVPQQTINNTASTLAKLFGSVPSWWKPQKPTYVGGYDVELITAPLRTFIGGFDVPNGVDPYRKNAAVQQWYGEYSLPAQVYAVPRGTNLAEYGRTHRLNDNAPIFLKKGFIIVNFDIETIRNGDLNNPHLQYIRTGIPEANQWRREGFNYQITDPYGMRVNLIDGDVVFYHADKSSSDDFGESGTH